ncbi:hypothetical protein [Arthrobacter sp. PAMC25284]|uniref:hypothetical protein n=1 Tax=Arthrobacter sp. PAMC25284 TaxID=2861279 RepID=UPI001C625696|nr:hypothetical protein [Arthrobacter sp. PAMC25284]QYF91056.1 hypothetical protein KY499_07640 [Arthrobacter sp. PAMC25284]
MNEPFSGAAGVAFAAGFKALKVLRPDRPIHPVGVALTGTIDRQPEAGTSGIPWVDTPGSDAVSARLSRSVGTPPGWPDILGLALRITTETGPADVLLASTGMSRPGRLVLTAHRHASNSKLTSLMPYKGSAGAVLLAARPEKTGKWLPATPDAFRRALGTAPWTLGLYYARPAGRWIRFGTLVLRLDPGTADLPTRFDPLEHSLPGAGTYGWARRLRKPSYEAARQPAP